MVQQHSLHRLTHLSFVSLYTGFKPNKVSTLTPYTFESIEEQRSAFLNYVGECDDTAGPCDECEGDCDSDDECSPGLSCFHREALEAVPGCSGGSEFDIPGTLV